MSKHYWSLWKDSSICHVSNTSSIYRKIKGQISCALLSLSWGVQCNDHLTPFGSPVSCLSKRQSCHQVFLFFVYVRASTHSWSCLKWHFIVRPHSALWLDQPRDSEDIYIYIQAFGYLLNSIIPLIHLHFNTAAEIITSVQIMIQIWKISYLYGTVSYWSLKSFNLRINHSEFLSHKLFRKNKEILLLYFLGCFIDHLFLSFTLGQRMALELVIFNWKQNVLSWCWQSINGQNWIETFNILLLEAC